MATVVLLASLMGCKPEPPTPSTPAPTPEKSKPADARKKADTRKETVPAAPSSPVVPAVQPMPTPKFQLPTRNTALIKGVPEKYFMFVDRTINNVPTEVWQGGQYGFVRDPKTMLDGSTIYTRFHEGMDVMPVARNSKGEPTDAVYSMADGTVVYVNANPRKSNYGNYIIVEHPTGDGPLYSLYAHLNEIKIQHGSKVRAREEIATMGYTGLGINRRRAHCHVELNMLLNKRTAIWEQALAPTPMASNGDAKAGTTLPSVAKPASEPKLNGSNLVGIDLANWLITSYESGTPKLSEFVRLSKPYFKVRVPSRGTELEIVHRYPWLRRQGRMGQSWEISVTAASIPISIEPLAEATPSPHVSWVQHMAGNHGWYCRSVLGGSGNTATLTAHGLEYLRLLMGE